MFRRIKSYLTFFVSFILFITLGLTESLALHDTIVAVVDDEVITLKNLSDYLRATYIQLRAEGRPEEEIEKIISDFETSGLERLIEDRLIVHEAKRKGLEIRPKIVDDKLQEIRKKYPSEEDFVNALMADGLTITDLRNKIIEQFQIKYIIEIEVRSKIFVNPQEVTDYYATHKDEFRHPMRINLDSIFIKFNNDKQNAQQKAQETHSKIKAGVDFKEVAKNYSDSPSIGIVKKGDLLPGLEEAVYNLNIGEVTQPLQTENGIFIFKVLGKSPEESIPLEDVKQEITNKIFQKKFKERYQEWLEKLKKQSYVEIKE